MSKRSRQMSIDDHSMNESLGSPYSYSGREFTPLLLDGLSRMRETSPPTSIEKRRRVEWDSDGDEEGDVNDDQEQDEETLRRRFIRPNKSIPERIRNLLDLAAEDSDEDGELEDENDEATLSDKDFLDDQAQDDGPIRPPSLPEYRDEHENDLALAAYYESAAGKYQQEVQREASAPAAVTLAANITRSDALDAIARSDSEEGQLPVVPGTWVCPQRGKARGQLAFVLTATKLYIGEPPEPLREQSRSLMKRKDFPRVAPTPDQLVPFAASQHDTLLALRFEGPCPALAEGDRVVVVAGEHKGMNGFIAVLREMWNEEKRQRIEYAKVVLPGHDGAYQIKKVDKGAHVELAHLKRAGLNFGYKFLVNDRVRVVSGILYKGATGRVMDVANDRLTISIPNDFDVVGPTTASAVSPHIKLFTIEIGHVSRVWYLGDSVRVRWDEHKGRTGVIVASNVGGILEIFDVCTFLLSLPGYKLTLFGKDRATDALNRMGEDEVAGMEQFKVRAADVDPNDNSANPTAVTVGHKTIASEPEAKIALMRVGLRYEYLQVYVGSKSRHKGLCGMVVGDYDSPARAARLKKKREKGKNPWWDQEGILVTIREGSTNHRVEGIPIESVYHQFTTLPLTKARFLPRDILMGRGAVPVFAIEPPPPDRALHAPTLLTSRYGVQPLHPNHKGSSRPPQLEDRAGEPLQASSHPPQLEGEITGEWMCIPDLAHKRVDVQVVGIKQLRGRVSQTMLALEGKFGYLLLAGPASIVDQKIEVYGVGKHGTKHAIDRTCIKPRQEDDLKRRLWEITERVVVLGPDVHSDTRHKGNYGQTIPYLQHTHGPDVVGVKFEKGGAPNFFHMWSLCLAKNIRIQAAHGTFDATVFA
ncbi:hypothetical protein DFH08DRAFT_822066 [Mycena albidolilacea]|uniref:Uncharacterized protein n=1 Tax=Mycena albidolilacea TaxID=1033008 RepID=A0AAD6Z9R5_9AGAR|nr:hypothetical protein DFH08DRAFT_822066 [Mycena albidolilacea]